MPVLTGQGAAVATTNAAPTRDPRALARSISFMRPIMHLICTTGGLECRVDSFRSLLIGGDLFRSPLGNACSPRLSIALRSRRGRGEKQCCTTSIDGRRDPAVVADGGADRRAAGANGSGSR